MQLEANHKISNNIWLHSIITFLDKYLKPEHLLRKLISGLKLINWQLVIRSSFSLNKMLLSK